MKYDNDFYRSHKWKKKREEVLELYHHECQRCKERGKLTKATTVHHEKPLKDYPELAFEIFLEDGTPQLIPLCFDCHEAIEYERGNRPQMKETLTPEWW